MYVADSHGRDVRRLTSLNADAAVASWSPDGYELVFTSDLHGAWDIHTVHLETGELRRLTTGRVSWGARWSPDGERIAFFGPHENPDSPEEIFVMSTDGSDIRRLTHNDTRETYPDWSPDGKTLLFGSHRDGIWDCYVIDVESGEEERVTTTPPPHHGSWLGTWSPDGESIAFVSDRHSEYVEKLSNTEIYVMRLESSDVLRLTHNDAFDVHPDW